MSVIKYNFKDMEGNLANPDSATLSSSDSTYGAKRNDTDEVVIPDGTAFDSVGTGLFEYGFADPAYNLTYTYSVEAVYEGVTYYSVFDNFKGQFVQTNDLYATVDEWKTFVDYTGNGYADTDAEITVYLRTASRWIDDYCNRKFYDDWNINEIPHQVNQVCMIAASRYRDDNTSVGTGAVSETIGRYSYTGNSEEKSNINGLTPNEYQQLIKFRRIKRV